jgi:hypothetical protein
MGTRGIPEFCTCSPLMCIAHCEKISKGVIADRVLLLAEKFHDENFQKALSR